MPAINARALRGDDGWPHLRQQRSRATVFVVKPGLNLFGFQTLNISGTHPAWSMFVLSSLPVPAVDFCSMFVAEVMELVNGVEVTCEFFF
jgi:hypothetical protein